MSIKAVLLKIPVETHSRFKAYAKEAGTTLREAFVSLVADGTPELAKKIVKKTTKPVAKATSNGKKVVKKSK